MIDDMDDDVDELRSLVSDVEIAAYRAGIKRGVKVAKIIIEDLEAKLEKAVEALRSLDPNALGSGPSTDMHKLHYAQMAARNLVAELTGGNDD